MNQGIYLLDQALGLARQEMSALDDGEYENAVQLATRRGELISRAWGMLDTGSREKYRNRLLELNGLQDQLARKARETQALIRDSLGRSRKEKQRMRGYHLAVSQALQ